MNKIILEEWLSRIIGKPAYLMKSFNTSLKKKIYQKVKCLFGQKFQLMNKKINFFTKIRFLYCGYKYSIFFV